MTTVAQEQRCRVCGFVGIPDDLLDGLLHRCGRCAFIWTARELDPPELLYDSEYFAGAGYEDYFDAAARRYEARRRLQWLLSSGPVTSLVEAGAAGGYFVQIAREAGIDAEGVEISSAAAAYAREQLRVPVRQGAFESVVLDPAPGVICAFHILEHVADPRAFLAAAHRSLRPGGRIAIEVPNIAAAAARRLGCDWPHLELRYHRWHFSPDSLRRIVESSNFEVVAQDSIFSRFYWRPLARHRNARTLFIADTVAGRSPRITNPSVGDAIRLIARRVPDRGAA